MCTHLSNRSYINRAWTNQNWTFALTSFISIQYFSQHWFLENLQCMSLSPSLSFSRIWIHTRTQTNTHAHTLFYHITVECLIYRRWLRQTSKFAFVGARLGTLPSRLRNFFLFSLSFTVHILPPFLFQHFSKSIGDELAKCFVFERCYLKVTLILWLQLVREFQTAQQPDLYNSYHNLRP